MLTNEKIDSMSFQELCKHLSENPNHVPLAIIRISSTSFERGVKHGEDKMMKMMLNINSSDKQGV